MNPTTNRQDSFKKVAHRAPDPEPDKDPTPVPHPVPEKDPVPDHNPEQQC
ncbi:hypothetical protein BH11PSE11_BH11PSE11_36320 [soil metagenome]